MLNHHRTVESISMQANAATTNSGEASRNENNNVVTNSDHTKALDSTLEFIKVELECYKKMAGSRHKSTEQDLKPGKNTVSRSTS